MQVLFFFGISIQAYNYYYLPMKRHNILIKEIENIDLKLNKIENIEK